MRLRRLQVEDFGCLAQADVTFGPGLSVLYGPNDLGKTTLKRAIQAALLLQTGSSAARDFVPWGTDRRPQATLSFEVEGRIWRVRKVWSQGAGRSATLEWSNDGHTFTLQAEGRAVDGELRALLGWGLAQPGGRGGTHGLPKSFLRSVLLGEQALPYSVLEESLDEDPDESGRRRLSDALQAMATDAVYQEVLERAQNRVDEVFTPTGKKKKTKDSPFRQVADEIRRREEFSRELEARVGESEAVAARLAELDAVRDRCVTARAQAEEELAELRTDLQRMQLRAAKAADVEAARIVVEDIERNQAEIARLVAERQQLEQALPQAKEAAAVADGELRSGHNELDKARQRLQAAQEGTDAEDRLALEELARRRVELQSQLQSEQRQQERAAACARVVEQASELAGVVEEAAQRATETVERLQAAEARLARLQDARVQLRAARTWLRHEQATAAVAAAEHAVAESARMRSEAQSLRDQAGRIEDDVSTRGLPDAEVLGALVSIEQEMKLAEARMGTALAVRLELHQALQPRAQVDGRRVTDWDGASELQARHEVVLELPGIATLTLQGGEVDAREAAMRARTAYAEQVAPALERAGVTSVAELRRACERAQEEQASARALVLEAETLEARAHSHDEAAAALPERQRTVAEHARGLNDIDLALARAAAEAAGDDATLRARIEDLEAELAQAQNAVSNARQSMTEARARAAMHSEQLDAVRAQAEQARQELGDDPQTILERAGQRIATVREELEQLDAAEVALSRRRQGAVERAREAVEVASERADELERRQRQAQAEAARLQEQLSSTQGALQVRREQARRADPLAAAETFARLQDELSALPVPQREVTADDVEQAERRLEAAEHALQDAMTEVRKQEGALQQVGGTVVRERAEAAREALEATRRHEAELELEFEGWKVLLQTLREAQNEEGHHLGRVLGARIGERFGALTAGRYGALQMGPDLRTEGLQTGSGARPIEALSEGLKEQLATILRVSVAEHLQGALILDDHLTQTDPARVAWFRDLLRAAAQKVQIVVFTCRPSDYLTPVELSEGPSIPADSPPEGGVHVVDLTRRLTRLAPGAVGC